MIKAVVFLLLSVTLLGCKNTQKPDAAEQKAQLQESLGQNQVAVKEEPLVVPDAVQNELMPDITQRGAAALKDEKRFQISAKDVEAAEFFGSLVQDTPYSMAIHPGVSGLISLRLKHVSLDEVLDVVSDIYGYDIKRKGRIFHIYPAGMRVETFPLNYLLMKRLGESRTTVATGHLSERNNNQSNNSSSSSNNSSSSNSSDSSGRSSTSLTGTRITTRTDTNYWASLEQTLVQLIGGGEGRRVVVSPMAGLVTIRAYPEEIRVIEEYLERSEEHLQRQVILETQIIEVVLNEGYQQGIKWQDAGDKFGDTNVLFNSGHRIAEDVVRTAIGGGGALTISNGKFEAVISLLETQGDVNVLSKPKVTVINNQKAVIKVGQDEYFVTDFSTTTVTGTSTATTPNVELTPFFSGISLDVTPQIDENGGVLLHIHPSIIDIEEQTKSIVFAGTDSDGNSQEERLELPLAKSDIRESDTVVKAQSNDVIVIGGLMKTLTKDLVSKTPLVGDIPYLGELFTNRSKQTFKTELVILLKPTVVEKGTWSKELERSSELLEKWYPSN